MQNVEPIGEALLRLIERTYSRGLRAYLDGESGMAGIGPSAHLTDTETKLLRDHRPEFTALVHGYVRHVREMRLYRYYKLSSTNAGLMRDRPERVDILLASFEAKHGPAIVDVEHGLFHALECGEASADNLMGLGRHTTPELIAAMENERAAHKAKVRQILERQERAGLRIYFPDELDAFDPGLLSMLADLSADAGDKP